MAGVCNIIGRGRESLVRRFNMGMCLRCLRVSKEGWIVIVESRRG